MPSTFQVACARRISEGPPAEWEGLTSDNRGIYARFGYGELTVYLADVDDGPEVAAENGCLILLKVVELDNLEAGTMSFTELKHHTSGYIFWPDGESMSARI